MDNAAQALEEARRAGIDLSLLDVPLGLSYAERWEQHQEVSDLMFELRKAVIIMDKDFLTAKQVRELAAKHKIG